MDFAEDNHQGLAERSASVVDESPEKARSPSVASPHYRVSDEIDEVVEMYRSFGTTPSQSLRYSSLSERQEKVPLEALDSPSSIYSTSSRWTDESHDGRAEVCSEDVESGV